MAMNHGMVGPFDSSQEDWLSYIARLQNYFIVNDIMDDKEAKHQAILLSVCGVSTYCLIKSLAAPTKPEEVSFDDLVKLVQGHHILNRLQQFSISNFTPAVDNPEKLLVPMLLN